MRVVIQRVSEASVTVNNEITGKINKGLLILTGFEDSDNDEDINWICKKIIQLRIFNDNNGVMNLSVQEAGGEILTVSQFTLHALTKKGNRPSYIRAAKPEIAISLYEKFNKKLSEVFGKPVPTGIFGAMMNVHLVNDGPVTIIIDTKNKE
ncbi:MAG TPA: D-aminoacyl-tRNA deacylase [Bacteroidales bacterium]|nr:D-aminoacyl-tRNA deacylase [Bacteroidales bacterium]HPS16077.1 D-aminoacyl-tRNA deacylase [Bacteroidales bacterium]